ncbi:MAG: glycoside hydrolase family 18 protein [Gracilimonas sp.]|nr:glycoside hydrolase family 18 protein [Gracilimonas sp.]
MAYLASWHYESPALNDSIHQIPTEEIEWQAITSLNYFGLTFYKDGSLIPISDYQDMRGIEGQMSEIVAAAHHHQVPVLLSVGGWQSRENFIAAVRDSSSQKNLISNLMILLKTYEFDGIDLNVEPVKPEDEELYEIFVDELYSNLQTIDTPLFDTPMLTATTIWQSDLFARIHGKLDHINLMTYNYSNAWEGWVSWHNSAIYNGGHKFVSMDKYLPSVNSDVERYIKAGVPRKKLSIGIKFYGDIWTGGVYEPLQEWTSTITPEVQVDVPYYSIMDSLFNSDYYRWDEEVKAAFLSIDNPGLLNDQFISFEEEKAIEAKIEYVKEMGLGGVFVWELSGGYQPDQPEGQKNPLQAAIKKVLLQN